MTSEIEIPGHGGAFRAHVAWPQTLPAPAVVVLHEVFGVNADIRQTCADLAARGYIAVAPHLFWRQEQGVDLSVTDPKDWEHGLALYMAYDRERGVEDVRDTVQAARALDGSTGKAAVMGYCLGGLMTWLTAARHDVDAAVAYHGGDTEKYLDEAAGVTAPLIMHLAGEDEFISKPAMADITRVVGALPNATVWSYAGQNHAFSRHGGTHYDAASAALANGRTWDFLARTLRTV